MFKFSPVILLFCLLKVTIPNAQAAAKTVGLAGHGGPVNTLAISPDGNQLISGSLDYSVMLWDVKANPASEQKRFIAHDAAVTAVRFFTHSSQKALSAGDDGKIYLWDVAKKKLLQSAEGHTGKVVMLKIANDDSMAASASWDGSIRLWSLPELKLLKTFSLQGQTMNSVLLSADKKLLYSGSLDGRIRCWDIASGQMLEVIHKQGWPVVSMEWLPGQQQFVFGSVDGSVQVFDVEQKKVVKILVPHEKPVQDLAVSSKQNLLATGGNDGFLRVWNIKDWSLIGETRNVPGPVWALAFADDGKSVFYGSLDDEIKQWPVTFEEDIVFMNKKERRFQVTQGESLGEVHFARKCSVCHTIKPGDANRAGPSLYQVFGRRAGTLEGYPYSEGLKASELVWDENTIDLLFSDGPDKVTPGSKMPMQKIPREEHRKALVQYLKEVTR